MNNIIKFGSPVVVLLLGIGAFGLLHATKPEPEKKEEAPRSLSVFVEDIRQADVNLMVTTSGEVRAGTEIDIVAQVAGRVVSVSPEFIEGGVVNPGETLITIEDRDFQLATAQARLMVAQAETGVQQVMADADVARKQLRNTEGSSDLASRACLH